MDNSNSVVNIILGLPLFQGITREQLQQLVEKYPFHFLKFYDGEPIAHEGERCAHLRFLISGTVRATLQNELRSIAIAYSLDAPAALLAERLFGMETTSDREIVAQGECGILQISKNHYFEMLQNNQVLLLNMINHLSYGAQSAGMSFKRLSSLSVVDRLAMIVKRTTPRRAHGIEIISSRQNLATLLACGRVQLMRVLTSLETCGVVEQLTTKSIKIAARNMFEQIN